MKDILKRIDWQIQLGGMLIILMIMVWSSWAKPHAVEAQATGSVYYVLNDHQGSVVALVTSNDEVAIKQSFDPWGNMRHVEGNRSITSIGWQGGYTGKGDTGLWLNGRYYHPETGRFLQRNPIDPALQGQITQYHNRYSYVHSTSTEVLQLNSQCFNLDCVAESSDQINHKVQSLLSRGEPQPSSVTITPEPPQPRRPERLPYIVPPHPHGMVGYFRPILNDNGGDIWVSNGLVDQASFARLVNQAPAEVLILSGTHGIPETSRQDPSLRERQFFEQDLHRWGDNPYVTVRDINEMSYEELRQALQGDTRVILAWCFSEFSEEVRELLNLRSDPWFPQR